MQLIIEEIIGVFRNYCKVYAPNGYCFYDIDDEEERRNYMTEITTPLINRDEIEKKFILVEGDVDLLNHREEEQPEYGE